LNQRLRWDRDEFRESSPTRNSHVAPEDGPSVSNLMPLGPGPDGCNRAASVSAKNVGHRRFRRILSLRKITVRRVQRGEVQTQQNLARGGFRVGYLRQPGFVYALLTINDPCSHGQGLSHERVLKSLPSRIELPIPQRRLMCSRRNYNGKKRATMGK